MIYLKEPEQPGQKDWKFVKELAEPIHLHFNWDQKEIISAQEIVSRLKTNNVTIAAVSSTPTHLALELSDAARPFHDGY